MSYLTPSPSKPVPSTPRRDSIHHAIVNAKNNNSPPSIRRQMRRNRVLRDIPTSQLTWDNYISSQKLFDKRRKTNPLRLISTLRHVLFSRKYLTTRAVGIVEVREKFEMLLTEINGPWNGLHDTLRSIPVGQAQVLQIANARFITLINDWSPPLQGSLISFSCRQETRQVIQELNVAIEHAALIKTRELEDMRIKAKHEEFAEFFKNQFGNADLNVYGNLVVNNRATITNESISDNDVAHIVHHVHQLVSKCPATIIPLVKANPGYFFSMLPDMEKVEKSFPLTSSLVREAEEAGDRFPLRLTSTSNELGERSHHETTTPQTTVGTSSSTVTFKCYVCRHEVNDKHALLLHVKRHEPPNRSTADAFHESSFAMAIPTESQIDVISALHLFRQGDENSPPAVLWSKKTRQNKRIYTRLQLVDSIYQSIGHVCFMSEYTNVKLNLLKKKE